MAEALADVFVREIDDLLRRERSNAAQPLNTPATIAVVKFFEHFIWP